MFGGGMYLHGMYQPCRYTFFPYYSRSLFKMQIWFTKKKLRFQVTAKVTLLLSKKVFRL